MGRAGHFDNGGANGKQGRGDLANPTRTSRLLPQMYDSVPLLKRMCADAHNSGIAGIAVALLPGAIRPRSSETEQGGGGWNGRVSEETERSVGPVQATVATLR